jgi:hypothetical protein
MNTGHAMLSDSKFYSGYSRWDETKGGYESWDEAVSRVMSMHRKKYAEKMTPELDALLVFAEDAYKDKLVLGAQRALQFGGEQIFKNETRMYNCATSHCDRPKFFNETMHLLLCGTGVGFSVQKHHIAKLPKIARRSPKKAKVFQVPDSIEGWADAFAVLLSSYFVEGATHPEFRGAQIHFDFSKIRPRGAMISGGFKAPGPDGLRAALVKCEDLLESVLREEHVISISSLTAYDFVMHMSDAVLSGGVRRSATICLFDKDDQDMLTAKTGDWFVNNPQRGRSNNSAVIVRKDLNREEWADIMKNVKSFGEPGFIFVPSKEHAYNPCCEIAMLPVTEDGESGWQFCVSGDTKLITKDGLVGIESVIGKEIEIWNGQEWSNVKPYQTGDQDRLHRVFFSDGSYLDATDNHKFLVKHRFEKTYREVQTIDLINEISTSRYKLSVPRSNIKYEGGIDVQHAYDFGFVLGDGCVPTNKKTVFAGLFGKDKQLNFTSAKIDGHYFNQNGTPYTNVTFDLDVDFCRTMKYESELPNEIFSWSKESILKFIAGWADADGTNASKGIRIYGREDKIRSAQLLLSKIGIDSSVNLMSKKGSVTNLCVRLNDVWYLQITKTFEIPCQRLKCDNESSASFKGRNQVVSKIVTLDGLHKSFCLTEEKLNQCVFNNVLTKQCNLVEVNGGFCDTVEKYERACKAGAILGTLQAGYTNFQYVTEATKKITEREALIGVSITGWMNNPEILFDKMNMRTGAEIVKKTNSEMAKILGINQAARCTTVKPSGNASTLLGTASGIHGEHSKRYFRHVQMNDHDEVTQHIQRTNPAMVERSVWSSNNTDVVVAFPIESKDTSIYKRDLLGTKQLDYVKLAQQNWIEFGTNVELCTDPTLRHNVSNTITVDDWDVVEQYLFDNREYFAGVSLLSAAGDKAYVQAPFTEVFTAQEIMDQYGTGSILASGLIVDALHSYNKNLWQACDTVMGHGLKLSDDSSDLLKRDWVRRAEKFAANYFGGDLGMMTNCLKDCYNLHKWHEINRDMVLINFSTELSKQSYTDVDTLGAQGCSGDACTIAF